MEELADLEHLLETTLKELIDQYGFHVREEQFDQIISLTLDDIDEETESVEMCLFDWLVTILEEEQL